MSFWNCSVVSSFSSNWVSTSLGADYCLNDREPFSVFTYSRLNTRGGWENLRKLCKPDTQSRVCITFNKFSNLPRVFKWDNVNTGKSTLYTLSIYHINCGVIQGFPALRKAVTTHVKKYRIFSRVPISCLHVTRLWRHSVRLMNEQQSLNDSQHELFVRAFLNYGG